MREDPPSHSDPDTLLALVGTSPLPPLRTALAFPPRRLVLAHSSDTRARAEQIATAARTRGGVEHVELVDLGGQVFDFHAVRSRLEPFQERMTGRPWRLCFTGGTKVMAIEAALAHCAAFPERHDWRSYLDVSTDTIWCTDGSRRDDVAEAGVDLGAMAGLHGVRLKVGEKSANDTEKALQTQLETLVGGADGWESLRNVEVPDPFLDGQEVIGEFDLVMRRGHRVVCVEHKEQAKALLRGAGWTLALAQRVFGAATGVLLVHEGDPDPTLSAQLAEIDPYLNGGKVFGCARKGLARHFPNAEALSEAFFGTPVEGFVDGSTVTPPLAPDEHPPPGAPVLMALGGSRLGVLAAAATHRPDPLRLLYSRESERELSGIKDAVRCALFAEENENPGVALQNGRLPSRARRDYESRVRCAPTKVAAWDVAAVTAAAAQELDQDPPHAPAPIADITTGTKAMNLGLALAVSARGGCVTYISPHTRTVRCREHGEVGTASPTYVDWRPLLRGYRTATAEEIRAAAPDVAEWVDVELLAAATTAAQHHSHSHGRTAEVWVDTAALPGAPKDLRRKSVAQRPTVVVTVGDRALGLSAPRQLGDQGTHRTAWAHAAFAATKVVQRLCGPAGRTLALLHPDAGDPTRADDLRRWMAWHGGAAPEELTAHEEMYRPATLLAAAGDPALAEALDALLPR